MRWLLDKPFEFYTDFSLEKCEQRLMAESQRRQGFFASRRAILVTKMPTDTGVRFKLDRDMGRNLYAEVWVTLTPHDRLTTRISGYGRVPLVNFLFLMFMFVFWSFMAYTLEIAPIFLANLIILTLGYISFTNRNDLIKIVYQTLHP